MKLTVIIPCYNEEKTINELINKVINNNYENKEIIIIDDCSTDKSKEIIGNFENKENFKIIYHEKNMGKGSCIKSAIKEASGEICIIQDADLEYDPADYCNLITHALKERLDVVIGSRVSKGIKFHAYKLNEWGIARLTSFTNLLFHTFYTDVATCYKLMRTSKLKELELKSNGFNLDFELCAKFAKHGWKIGEVKIRYEPRTYKEGRKMRPLKGGVGALITILREWITKV